MLASEDKIMSVLGLIDEMHVLSTVSLPPFVLFQKSRKSRSVDYNAQGHVAMRPRTSEDHFDCLIAFESEA